MAFLRVWVTTVLIYCLLGLPNSGAFVNTGRQLRCCELIQQRFPCAAQVWVGSTTVAKLPVARQAGKS